MDSELELRSIRSNVTAIRSVDICQWNPERTPFSHRHADPSGPWPWRDVEEEEADRGMLRSPAPPVSPPCHHEGCECWSGYPQSRFPNWTKGEIVKSKIWHAIHNYRRDLECMIFRCDVDVSGRFTDAGPWDAPSDRNDEVAWGKIVNGTKQRPFNVCTRTLFVQNVSGPVLQMLGTRFEIEPCFFSSSVNWIPSRFQEEIHDNVGDHIAVTLTFLKSVTQEIYERERMPANPCDSIGSRRGTRLGSQEINTQAPLALYSNEKVLTFDLLSVYLVRNVNGSTLISYHPSFKKLATSASYLHDRVCLVGQSQHWQNLFRRCRDPTLMLLCFLWHALYSWDAALVHLQEHICTLDGKTLLTARAPLARELHMIRVHCGHYFTLLGDFVRTIEFIQETSNPFMTEANFKDNPQNLAESSDILGRECKNLLVKVDRLKATLVEQEKRLNFAFSSINVADAVYMRVLTEAAIRDSAAMKQIAYVTMIFLPGSFIASIFGMNVTEINPGSTGTVPAYLSVALPFTIFTLWVGIAVQSKSLWKDEVPFWWRLSWPLRLLLGGYRRSRPTFDYDVPV